MNTKLINRIVEIAKNGQKEMALEQLLSFVEKNPTNERALFLLSTWLFQSMDWSNTVKYMTMLIELVPNNKSYLENMVGMHLHMSNFKAAIKYQKIITDLSTNNEEALYKLAMLHHRVFNFEEALKILKFLENKHPKQTQVLGVIADIVHGFGDFKLAIKYYYKILSIDPNNAIAFNGIVKSTKFKKIDNDLIGLGKKILEDLPNDLDSKLLVYFSFGKMFDDCKEYTKALQNYKCGNDIQSKAFPFNLKGLVEQIDQIKSIFDQKFFSENTWKGDDSISPIFIVGMPRSGTTLLEQVLENSKSICAGGESPALNRAINKQFYNIRYPDQLSLADSDIFNRLASDYKNYYMNCHIDGNKRSLDKLPGNFLYLGLLKKMFPKMKVINLSRNKLDCSLSIYFQMFTSNMSFTTDIKDISSFYDIYLDTMNYWNSLFSDNIYNLSYESLVSNFELETKELFKFLDLEWNDKVGEFVESKNSVQTPSSWQVRQGINTRSIGRSKNYADFLSHYLDSK